MKGSKHDRRLTRNKDVRTELALLERAGWVYVGDDSRGHKTLEHPAATEPLRMASTPSTKHWRRGLRHRAARLLGITVAQLEEAMGVQRGHRKAKLSGKAPKRAKPRPRVVMAKKSEVPDFPDQLPSSAELRRECHAIKVQLNGAPAGADAHVVGRLEQELAKKNRLYGEACRRERNAA